VAAIDWRTLTVTGGDRRAIYAETFPASLDWALAPHPTARAAFTQSVALGVLVDFVDLWNELPLDRSSQGRVVARGLPPRPAPELIAVVFSAIEIRPGQLVVVDVEAFHT
jgi:hypothetical protein